MTNEETEHLLNAYPNLYKHLRYFDCGSGWFDLINKLSSGLEELVADTNSNRPEDFSDIYTCASQVKEKYGGLRFYITCGTDAMYDLINKAEDESEHICELCGSPGVIQKRCGWLTCLCGRCLLKQMMEGSQVDC